VGWTFFFLMVVLKVPIVALFLIVRWAILATPDVPEEQADDGGAKRPEPPQPRTPPRRPRRGPHGDPPVPAPARTRAPAAPAVSRRSAA
jgi:hypothetical protein